MQKSTLMTTKTYKTTVYREEAAKSFNCKIFTPIAIKIKHTIHLGIDTCSTIEKFQDQFE